MRSLTCTLMFVSQIILLFFTETLFMAGAKLPLSVLVRIFLSKGVDVWLRLQVKNVVCTDRSHPYQYGFCIKKCSQTKSGKAPFCILLKGFSLKGHDFEKKYFNLDCD